MAMRQRSSGISNITRPRQSSNRPTYEDFQPRSELKEEHDAHITHVHLPGFQKEQVRITFVHSPGLIRVHGQRPLGNNKWSRFNQTFPLPENSDASNIHGKFHNEILTITIPKEVIKTQIDPKDQGAAVKPIQEPAALTPSKTATTADATPQKVLEKEEEKVPSDKLKEKDNRSAPPSISSAVTSIVRKGQDAAAKAAATTAAGAAATADAAAVAAAATAATAAEAIAKASAKARKEIALLTEGIAETKESKDKEGVHNENQRDEKRVIPLSSPSPPNAASTQKGRDEIPPKTMEVDQKAKEHENEVRNKDTSEPNVKPAEVGDGKKIVETPLYKEKGGGLSTEAAGIERLAPETTLEEAKRKSKRFVSGVEQEMNPKEERQGLTNLVNRINNYEEKQLLINVGAAFLVLVAFGAYASYGLWSSGKSKY